MPRRRDASASPFCGRTRGRCPRSKPVLGREWRDISRGSLGPDRPPHGPGTAFSPSPPKTQPTRLPGDHSRTCAARTHHQPQEAVAQFADVVHDAVLRVIDAARAEAGRLVADAREGALEHVDQQAVHVLVQEDLHRGARRTWGAGLLDSITYQPHEQGCMRREGTAEVALEAVGSGVGGCQSGWGQLLSVTNAIEAGTCGQGGSGWAYAGRPGGGGLAQGLGGWLWKPVAAPFGLSPLNLLL